MLYSLNIRPWLLSFVILPFLVSACGNDNTQHAQSAAAGSTGKQINTSLKEAFVSTPASSMSVVSPAVWIGPENQHWLIAAAPSDNKIDVFDATTGALIKSIGSAGSGPGQFRDPVALSVVDNLAVVVDRGNKRAQVFLLPDFTPLGAFGQKQFQEPSGITMYRLTEDRYYVFVTDNFPNPDSPGTKGKHIHKFEMNYFDRDFRTSAVAVFGATQGPGVLKQAGSIYMDPLNNHLLIADIDPSQNNIKVYDVDGKFTGKIIDGDIFKSSPDGIALYQGESNAGFWIVTDHSETKSVFHVLDRRTFAEEGSFTGESPANSAGVCLTETSFAKFPKGAFYSLSGKGGISCFSLDTVINKLHVRTKPTGLTAAQF